MVLLTWVLIVGVTASGTVAVAVAYQRKLLPLRAVAYAANDTLCVPAVGHKTVVALTVGVATVVIFTVVWVRILSQVGVTTPLVAESAM